jgi:hypothetical protein
MRGIVQVIGFRRSWARAGLLGCALVAGTTAVMPMASATAGAQSAVTGGVSSIPASGTPRLAPTRGTEQVRQIAECGGTMYAVGTFSAIEWGGKTYPRRNAFSFSATSPYRITSWNPDANGEVNSIALAPDCRDAWLGGSFTKVAGTSVGHIAKVGTATGSVVTGWAHDASKPVDTVLYTPNGHVLVGGEFTTINGSGRKYYASLNPATGRDDGYLNLNIAGKYVYPGAAPNSTQAYNQQLSPDGRRVLVEGVFTSVQGQSRQQIFMLSLGASHGDVSGWNSAEFSQHCADAHPFYIKGAAWSPDQSTVYIATTGEHPDNWSGSFPLTGLCDVAAAFPSTPVGGLTPKWVNYTGCDSLYAAAADPSTLYVGGHERWADNPRGCNRAGRGAVPAPGMGGFTPGGTLLKNAGGTAGRYSRARGLGADDMLRTSAGLWIASDNFESSTTCGGVTGHAGICFLPNS